MSDVDAAENDAGAHFGVIEAERFDANSSARLMNAVGDSAQPIDVAM
jgi:hypothetical protein